MAISEAHQADIQRVVEYWFTPITPSSPVTEKWFLPPNPQQIDDEIRTQFGSLVEQARSNTLDSWTSTPMGSLALIILLDQYPRNIYRGSHLMHAADQKGVEVAVQSIAKEFDRSPELQQLQTLFFYLPLMHAEDLIHQIASIAYIENLATRCASPTGSNFNALQKEDIVKFVKGSLGFSKMHREVILRFGRFPSRNEALGRTSTPEELEFLKENPSGYPEGEK